MNKLNKINKIIYLLILKTTLSTKIPLIRYTDYPLCLNCLYFIEHENNYPYDPLPNNKQYGRCKKFGEIDLVTGLVEYDIAKNCRNDIKKCGKSGLEYKEKPKF
jgi:hypothetical protein